MPLMSSYVPSAWSQGSCFDAIQRDVLVSPARAIINKCIQLKEKEKIAPTWFELPCTTMELRNANMPFTVFHQQINNEILVHV